jgi:hypothetical protein
MPTNYRILKDGAFTLSADQDQLRFDVELPNGALLIGNQRPILAFLVKPNGLTFRVDINDTQVLTTTLGGDERGVFWEVINPNVARVGLNTIQFRGISGFGNAQFSDVVLWFTT